MPGIRIEVLHRRSPLQLNTLFLNDGIRGRLKGKKYRAINMIFRTVWCCNAIATDMIFPTVCCCNDCVTGYTKYAKMSRVQAVCGLLINRVVLGS